MKKKLVIASVLLSTLFSISAFASPNHDGVDGLKETTSEDSASKINLDCRKILSTRGASEMVRGECAKIANDFALQCVQAAAFDAGTLTVDACGYIDNQASADCVKKTYFDTSPKKIEACSKIRSEAALECVQSDSLPIEIESCSSLK